MMEESRGYPGPIVPGRTRVGWIGAGVMGAAMAGRILAAGYELVVYARTPAKAVTLKLAGAAIVSSPAAAAESSDVVFTMVSHPSDVLSVAVPAVSALPFGGVLVDATSSDPALAREIAGLARARGCWAVDAPVSGGDVGARDGTLAILAGGEEGVVDWLSPLFRILGTATWMGAAGSGQSAKIANQIAVGGSMLGMSEALAFVAAARIDAGEFLAAARGGDGWSRVMEIFGERVVGRDFGPGAFAEYMVKDLGMGVDGGAGKAVVLPGAALCRQLYSAMVANGDGKMGMQGLITVIERINGHC